MNRRLSQPGRNLPAEAVRRPALPGQRPFDLSDLLTLPTRTLHARPDLVRRSDPPCGTGRPRARITAPSAMTNDWRASRSMRGAARSLMHRSGARECTMRDRWRFDRRFTPSLWRWQEDGASAREPQTMIAARPTTSSRRRCSLGGRYRRALIVQKLQRRESAGEGERR